jgi:hypothetical protein
MASNPGKTFATATTIHVVGEMVLHHNTLPFCMQTNQSDNDWNLESYVKFS